jgi:heme A synthase
MRKQKLQAHLGGWTVSFDLDDNGIVHAFTTQFHPFYDRSFYENSQWEYRWNGTDKHGH